MPSNIVEQCSEALARRELTIAFAESATAGRLASEFSLCQNSGQVLKGGIVCYDALLKQAILHVPKEMIERFTPESAEVTQELAHRLQSFIPAEVHAAVTGLTCAGGSESEEKPVGTIFFHIYIDKKSVAGREVFHGTPEEIIMQAIDYLAGMIISQLAR